MPAIYPIDLIEKRDKKRRMDRSIIKGWNVHYQTLAEVEEEARLKRQKQEEEKALREPPGDTGDDSSADTAESETEENHAQAYNRKTGSYSGHYGKEPVRDEAVKSQIDAILNEKKEAFGSALSALQEEYTMSE